MSSDHPAGDPAVRGAPPPRPTVPGGGRSGGSGGAKRRLLRSGEALAATTVALGELVDTHAVRLLGISGQEFRRRWYDRAYDGVEHPGVLALDRLMRTGHWVPTDQAAQPA